MDPTALRHAEARLVKAEQAAQALQTANSFDAIDSAWTDFLLAVSTLYSKLGQGAKGHPKSDYWFGQAKRLRKDDPLLSYLYHARNSDEHGIEDPTHRKAVGAEWVWPDGRKSVLRFESPDVQLNEQKGQGVPMCRVIRYTDLVRVHDRRYGDHFDPPDTHLGRAINTRNPVEIAQIALPYLRQLISDARGLYLSGHSDKGRAD